MGYVSKIWDHKRRRFVRGHVALSAAVAFRGVVLPWRVELWKPKGHPGAPALPEAHGHGRGGGRQGVHGPGGPEGARAVRRGLPVPDARQGV